MFLPPPSSAAAPGPIEAWRAAGGLLLAFSLTFSLGLPRALAAEPRVLALADSIATAPYTTPQGDGFADIVATEAFRRAGLVLRIDTLPSARGLLLANAGLEDGQLARLAGIEKQYPNLVRVPEKLATVILSAFSRNAAIPSSFTAIRGRSVGLVRGWQIYEDEMAGAPQVVMVEDAAQLFRLLNQDRIEVALYSSNPSLALLNEERIQGVHILEPPLGERDLFIYLHKSHAEDAPRIAAALRALKQEGYYQRVFDEKVKSYLERPPQ